MACRLTEERLTANEDRIQLEPKLGRHHELVGELTGLGIWLGAFGPRMLALAAAKADGWIPSQLPGPGPAG